MLIFSIFTVIVALPSGNIFHPFNYLLFKTNLLTDSHILFIFLLDMLPFIFYNLVLFWVICHHCVESNCLLANIDTIDYTQINCEGLIVQDLQLEPVYEPR